MGMRIGLIGAGSMGGIHARLLTGAVHGADLVAVADADVARASALASSVAGAAVRVHGDPVGLVGDADVDAVLVASSDASHEAFVTACLEAGKPVLCEKPLAATAAAGLRLATAEAAGGRRLVQVGFMRRYDPGYLDLKAVLDGGLLGAPLVLHCVHRNPSVPPDYTGDMLVTNTAVHEFDAIRWLLGQEIVSVGARVGRAGGRRLPEPQLLLLETEDGVLIDVEVNVHAGYGYDVRCEVVGESATAALAPPRTVEIRRDGSEGARIHDGFESRFEEAYRRELQAWVAGLASGRTAGPSTWDGYVASAVAEACLESLAAGTPCDVRLAARPAFHEGAALTPTAI
jgi:myo-inositol 2-dehydrogenase/D-chiro-inositol 1-dehydrogenase